MIGSYDAAVIDKGKRQASHREAYGPSASPPKATAGEAGLIAVGDPTVEKAVDSATADAAKVTKRFVDAATDEIADELREALGG